MAKIRNKSRNLAATITAEGRKFKDTLPDWDLKAPIDTVNANNAFALIEKVKHDLYALAESLSYNWIKSIDCAIGYVRDDTEPPFVRAAVASVLVCGHVEFDRDRLQFLFPDSGESLCKFKAIHHRICVGEPLYMDQGLDRKF